MRRRQGLAPPPARGSVAQSATAVSTPEDASQQPVAVFVASGRKKAKPTNGSPAASNLKSTSSTGQRPPPRVPAMESATIASGAGIEVGMDDTHQAFDQMPSSDSSYLHMMDEAIGIEDIALSNAFPSDDDDLVELNPTPTTKKRWARSTNYSVQEDEALVLAWENVSVDPVIGVDQSSRNYWKCIANHFHRNVKKPSNRSTKSLTHRWSSIQECCNRWGGCLEQIDRCPPSGSTIQDRFNHTQEMYKMREPKNRAFVMMHCWTLLEHNEKWRRRNEDSHPLRKRTSKSFSLDQEASEKDEEENGRSDTPSSAMPVQKRPPGRKQGKEKLNKGGDATVFQTAVQDMIASKKELEAEKKQEKELRWMEFKAMEERKVTIEQEKMQTKKMEQECKIMFMDMSGLLCNTKSLCGIYACSNSSIKDGRDWEWKW